MSDPEGVTWFREGFCDPCRKTLTDTADYWEHITSDDHKRRAKRWNEMRGK